MPSELTNIERIIIDVLEPDGTHIDDIALVLGVTTGIALSYVTILEIKGRVKQLAGRRFAPIRQTQQEVSTECPDFLERIAELESEVERLKRRLSVYEDRL